jgi:RNA polymerase sigma-70 factor (ECF subfamily)
LHNTDINDTNSNPEVESLVDRAISGDTEAFGRIFDIYADNIYRHIYYRIGNIEDAKDLVQDVFVKAWQAIPKYKRTSTPFLGWIYTISHNRIIDYYRTKKNYVYLDTEIATENVGVSPEKSVELQFTRRDVRKAILQLPEDQQQVIILCFIDGLEYSEVAALTNKTEGNIRVIVHRALKRMRKILGGEAGLTWKV